MSADFIFRETGSNLRRHGLAALASITTTALCLLILGGFILAAMMIQRFSTNLLDQSSMVAYVKPSVSGKTSSSLRRKAAAISGVKSVKLVSRERAWAEEKRKYRHLPELEAMENPLGDELHLSLHAPEKSKEIAREVAGLTGIEKVNEGGVVVDRLLLIRRAIQGVGLAVSGALLFATILIIGNAIRLGVFSRRREIRIMKLVGATDGFIRMPFLLEGLIHGALGALVACGLLAVGVHAVQEFVTKSLPFLPLSPEGLNLNLLFALLLVTGGFVGLSGSYLSVRRFLRTVE